MAAERFFLLGFVLDRKLTERLANCKPSDKIFLEDSAYLEQVDIDGVTYLGRRLDSGPIALHNVEDSAANVVSLIRRVAPGWSKNRTSAVLVAAEREVVHTDVVLEE